MKLKSTLCSLVKTSLSVSLLTAAFSASGVTSTNTFDYEAVKAKYSARDYNYKPLPEAGYHYYKIAEDTYFVHDDFENMVFFVTDNGVVVYDAKPDVTPFLLEVIPEVTDKKITHVIYSHDHADHAQGMHLFEKSDLMAKDAKIISNDECAELLEYANDPKRPMPDIVWKGEYVLETGGLRLEFKDLERNWHSHSDILVYAPQKKVLLATDTFHADAAPWIHFGETTDAVMTWELPQIVLDLYPDFEFVINGHERIVGTQDHWRQYKEQLDSMKSIMYEVVMSHPFHELMKELKMRYREGNEHAIYKEGIMTASQMSAWKYVDRWAGKVRNTPQNAIENFQTIFMHLMVLNPETGVLEAKKKEMMKNSDKTQEITIRTEK